MFDPKDLKEIKKMSYEKSDPKIYELDQQMVGLLNTIVIQNEQLINQLDSIGYKLYKLMGEKNV